MSKLAKEMMKTLQPLIDKKTEESTIKAELVAQVKLMAIEDNNTLKVSREVQLSMVDALIEVQKVAETIGIKVSNKELAEAYGKSTAWVSRTFKVASNGEKRQHYIQGIISITGNDLGDPKQNRIKEAHLILIEEKKPISALILADASGESLEDCAKYLEDFIGSLEVQGDRVKKTLLSYFNFVPKTKEGKPDNAQLSDDSRIEHISTVFLAMMRGKETHGDTLRRTMQKTLGKLGYVITQPKEREGTAKAQ